MEIIRGAPALSAFRVQKLMEACDSADLPVKSIYAEYMHLADLTEQLDDNERVQLERILTYGPAIESHAPQGQLVFITPRPGTISPWSSKMRARAPKWAKIKLPLPRMAAQRVGCEEWGVASWKWERALEDGRSRQLLSSPAPTISQGPSRRCF